MPYKREYRSKELKKGVTFVYKGTSMETCYELTLSDYD
jgi:hypothetical protein